MRIRMPLLIIVLLALWTAGAIHGQITNPIPAPVEKRGLMVEIGDVVRLPDTRGLRPADQDVTPGFSNGGGPHANNPGQTQRLDSVVTAILRFDPRNPTASGGVKGFTAIPRRSARSTPTGRGSPRTSG